MGMVLDGAREEDEVVNKDGSSFVINKELLKRVQPVKIDFVETDMGSGYTISSSLTSGGSCGDSCGSSCGC